jgi:uncharacterized cupredoxin-like copper-binding protein
MHRGLTKEDSMTVLRRPAIVGALAAAVIALVASAAVAFGLIDRPSSSTPSGPSMMSGATRPGSGSVPSSSPAAPRPSGRVVNVSLTDSGGPMGEGNGPMHPGAMGLSADQTSMPHGTVSFVVTNAGAVKHEMVILPMDASQVAGTRPFGGDAKVAEADSLGAASNSGGSGSGEGIEPGASSRVTVTLAAGRYELVCNLMGHYVSGMYRQLTVT